MYENSRFSLPAELGTIARRPGGEMADASALGADESNLMEVQVLSRAPRKAAKAATWRSQLYCLIKISRRLYVSRDREAILRDLQLTTTFSCAPLP